MAFFGFITGTSALNRLNLSTAQQALIDRMKTGSSLSFLAQTGVYELQGDGLRRTVSPRTVNHLKALHLIDQDLNGRCELSTSCIKV